VIEPSENPPQIPDTIKSTISIAKQITPHIAELSGLLVSSVHTVVRGVGTIAADQLKARMGNNAEIKDPRILAAKNLGKASANAFVNVWNSLEEAGMTLMSSTGKAVVNIVNHKFGDEAGQVAKDGFAVAQDVVVTSQTLRSMGMRGLAKTAAKHTTKTIIGLDEPPSITTPQITAELTTNEFQDLILPPTPAYVIDIDSDEDDNTKPINDQ